MTSSRKTKGSNSGSNRKHQKPAVPFSYLRTCLKIPTTLMNIYQDSPGLRSLMRWLFSVSFSLFLLCAIPLSFYSSRPTLNEYLHLFRTMKMILIGWSTLLAISPWFVIFLGSLAGFSLARQCHMSKLGETDMPVFMPPISETNDAIMCKQKYITKTAEILKRPGLRKPLYVIGLSIIVTAIISIQTNLHMMYPSWFWNPFLFYNVYWPSSIADASSGLCIDKEINQNRELDVKGDITSENRQLRDETLPLCLPEKSWKSLSSDALSSKNIKDVETVLNGVRFLGKESGGIAFGIMSRDTISSIAPLRLNVEGMLPFTSNLSVVVFENDSVDGTREAYLEWSKEVEGKYSVDVIECEESPGCKFHELHRDFEKDIPYERTSAIGRMGEFRQRMVQYILQEPKYANYSHYIVLDVDLGVSISPLGIVHSIGSHPDEAIVSSGRQVRPGALGSLVPPYDFSAFEAHENEKNKRMIDLKNRFCELKPEGYRWRNECRALSVTQFMMIEIGDKLNDGEPYLVDSAFNGATIYPIELIRESKAHYDEGIDGQRCEHIGFNLSLKRSMYINPKWEMHLHPHFMAGPSGKRAIRTVGDILKSPIIGPIVIGQSMVSMIVFVYCVITLTMVITYPLWVCISRSTMRGSENISKRIVGDRSKSPSMKEMASLLNPGIPSIPLRKRTGSEFDKVKASIRSNVEIPHANMG